MAIHTRSFISLPLSLLLGLQLGLSAQALRAADGAQPHFRQLSGQNIWDIRQENLAADFAAGHHNGSPPIDVFPATGGGLVDAGDPDPADGRDASTEPPDNSPTITGGCGCQVVTGLTRLLVSIFRTLP